MIGLSDPAKDIHEGKYHTLVMDAHGAKGMLLRKMGGTGQPPHCEVIMVSRSRKELRGDTVKVLRESNLGDGLAHPLNSKEFNLVLENLPVQFRVGLDA